MIAYFLLVHRYPAQFKRLFKAIYLPGNQYVVHVDKSSGTALADEISAFLKPYQGVEILEPQDALWGGYSLVDAELRGMARLMPSSMMSADNSGGVCSSADMTEPTICATQSLRASAICASVIIISLGRPVIRSRPLTAMSSPVPLGWFADIVLEAQGRTIESIRFLIEKTRLLDRLRGRINDRQEKALIRMMAEGPDGFVGGLSAHNYRTITDAASATATRDLAGLVELGALERVGERRYARYHLTIASRKGSDGAEG